MSSSWSLQTRMAFLTFLRSSLTMFFSLRSNALTENFLDYRSTDSKNSMDMDSEQKFTGGDHQEYVVDEGFYDKIKEVKRSDLIVIFNQLSDAIEMLPANDKDSQMVSGVIKRENPLYFTIEYFKDEDLTILIDYNETDSDGYLDAIIEGTSLGTGRRASEPTEDR